MKRIFLALIVPAAFVISMLLGSKARFKGHVSDTVEKIRPQFETLAANAEAPAPSVAKNSHPTDVGAVPKPLETLEHGTGNLKILHTRELMKLKKYEHVVLKSEQRESFKKVFLEIALSPNADWLMQRQALRNLYLHKIELSSLESDLLMSKVDQRAMNSLKNTDAEILKESVFSL